MTSTSATVREDIQGLRAIGALLVAVFHNWEGGISGGVDIFFVVSGYFLGRSYLRLCAKNEKLSAASHFGRFINRTMPEVLMVLLVVLTIGLAFQNPAAWPDLLKDIIYSALYLENYWLILQGQDYLARSSDLSMVQHFWAVSLIAQVYASWFVIVRVSDLIARLLDRPRAVILQGLLAALIVASFGWSLHETASNPMEAYFAFATRVWQFGAGAFLALALAARSGPRLSPVMTNALSWLGVFLLLSCGPVIGSWLAFPGIASLWPVSAAALILLTGHETDRSNASAYLGRPILSRLGAYSFGIYVWHWPLYVIAFRLGDQTPSIWLGSAIILAALGLAYLSKRVTDVIMYWSRRRLPPLGLSAACVAALMTLAVTAGGIHELGTSSAQVNTLAVRLLGLAPLSPGPLMAVSDATRGREGCNQTGTSHSPTECSVSHPDATTEVVLVGGSRSEHWMPALKAASEAQGWNISAFTKNACPFASPRDEDMYRQEKLHASCARWNEEVMEVILDEKPDVVITLATRAISGPSTADGEKTIVSEQVPEGYVLHLQRLADAGIPTVALRDTPRMLRHVPSCVFAPSHLAREETCDRPRDEVLHDDALAKELGRLPEGVGYLDMTDAFCDATTCYAVRDDMLVSRDSHHLTATYARHLGPALADRVTEALKRGQSPHL